MNEQWIKKNQRQLEKLSLPEQFLYMCDFLFSIDTYERTELKYTKEYFALYYGVDLNTFHKWVEIFCPELWSNGYKKRRKFSIKEAHYIYSCLGKYSSKEKIPRNHKEIMDFIYSETNWKKSKKYQQIKMDFEDRFSDLPIQLNILPPKLVTEILSEEIHNYKKKSEGQHFDFYEQRVNKLHLLITKYGSMTEREKEIKLRWFRRWWSQPVNLKHLD